MRRTSVSELREVIIRLRSQQGIREIHRETGIHRTIIRELKLLAVEKDWLAPENPPPSEQDIAVARYGEDWDRPSRHPLDKYKSEIETWVNKRYSYVVMHALLRERFPCDESTIRRYVNSRFPRKARAIVRRSFLPGQVMEVDFGYLGFTWDEESGRKRKTWCFSARLAFSRHAYREKVYDQRALTFFMCHIHAFEFFGGVPEKVIPDNLKAAVIKAAFYDPVINRAYRMLAEHYGFMISPCLPRKPQHKGGVENDIKYVKGNFLPIFRETIRQQGRELSTGQEMQVALDKWNRETAMVRILRGVGRQPIELFETEEKSALKSLPQERWDPVVWKECRARNDCRVQFEKAYYSVPYKLRGQKLMVCGNSSTVWIFNNYTEVTMHQRAKNVWQFVCRREHLPPQAEQYLESDRKGLLALAKNIDQIVFEAVRQIFSDKVYDGLRPARGVLFSLRKKFGLERLIAACRRALFYKTVSYTSIKRILEKELDKQPLEEVAAPTEQQHFRFGREPGYFDQ